MLAQKSVRYIILVMHFFNFNLNLAFCKNTSCIYLIYTFLLYKKIDFLLKSSMAFFLALQQPSMVKKCKYKEML